MAVDTIATALLSKAGGRSIRRSTLDCVAWCVGACLAPAAPALLAAGLAVLGNGPVEAASNNVRITNLVDVSFGTIANLGADAIQSQSVCVYADTNTNGYNITGIGTGPGGIVPALVRRCIDVFQRPVEQFGGTDPEPSSLQRAAEWPGERSYAANVQQRTGVVCQFGCRGAIGGTFECSGRKLQRIPDASRRGRMNDRLGETHCRALGVPAGVNHVQSGRGARHKSGVRRGGGAGGFRPACEFSRRLCRRLLWRP